MTIYIVPYCDRIPLNRVLWKRLKRSAQPFKTEKRSAFYQSPESLKNGCRQENKCNRGWQNCFFFVKNHFQRVWALLKTGFFGALKDCRLSVFFSEYEGIQWWMESVFFGLGRWSISHRHIWSSFKMITSSLSCELSPIQETFFYTVFLIKLLFDTHLFTSFF
jgi:hypothetical protein